MKAGTLLVFGARSKSIGQMVANMYGDMFDGKIVTAGISGDENHSVNYEDHDEMVEFFKEVKPDRVLVTVGTNHKLSEASPPDNMEFWLSDHLHVNCTIPMLMLEAWLEAGTPDGGHFVALSSNSAHIPRSQSMAYCASKAALSMAIRCAARDVGKAGMDLVIYGWEPGLVKGTQMSGKRGGTRMLGLPQGMPRRALAQQIAHTMAFGGTEYNGVLVRLDAGEV